MTESANLMIEAGHPTDAQEAINKLKILTAGLEGIEQINVPQASLKL